MVKSQKTIRAERRKRQRRIKALVLTLLGAVLLLAAGGVLVKQNQRAPIEVRGAPSLKVDAEAVDLGEVKLGKTVEVSFVLTNVGDQPLELTQAPYVEVVEGC
jgi:hypothetical protein